MFTVVFGSCGCIEQRIDLLNFLHHYYFRRYIRSLLFGDSQKDQAQNACILLSKAAQTFIARGRWFYPCTPVSSTKKTGRHYKTEILLKVALNSITKAKTRHSLRAVGDSLKKYNPHPHFTYLFSFFFLSYKCLHIYMLIIRHALCQSHAQYDTGENFI